jgi:hypothetical protein
MAAAMAFDVTTLGRVHATNAWTTLIMAAAFTRVLLIESPAWIAVGRSLLAPFL